MTTEPIISSRWTVADYMAMPDDGKRYEVLRGELRMAPGPSSAHQRAIARLGTRVIVFVEEHDLGECFYAPFDVVLADDTVLQPDFVFVSKERFAQIHDGHGLTGPPDLVIEVLSPSTERLDRTTRRSIFAESGIEWLVFVDPMQRSVEVYHLESGEYALDATLGEDDVFVVGALPGFELPLDKIWL